VIVDEAKYDDITRSSNYPGLFEGNLNGKKVYFEPGGSISGSDQRTGYISVK
jgi:hypothetical protein